MKWYNKIPSWGYALLTLGVIAIVALVEYHAGRVIICKCGTVEWWYGVLNGSGDSQHLADWYSFSHLIHGFLFYWLLRLISRKKWPMWLCLLLAVGIEGAWEVFENSSFIIDRYRESTIALDYYGDSILNSLSDIVFSIMGFILARRFPVWMSVCIVIALELWAGYVIHDNLTLNVIMLLHPFEFIKQWQLSV